LRAEGLEAEFDVGSVGVEPDAVRLVERTVERFGRIDILINNAGAGKNTPVHETTTEDFAYLLSVHLYGSFWTLRTALRFMREQNYGRVVNTSSAVGAFGYPGSSAYAVAKAGIIGLSKVAALENADRNIKINTILPIAYTPAAKDYMDKMGRNPDQLHVRRVTPAVLFLAHEDCPVSGEALSAGLGRVARVFTATVRGYSSDQLTCEEVFDHVDQIFDTTEFVILKSSQEQYDTLLPPP
jgi:NAD(P)-dependent dehydrogenase (short-subunit alcohol dehydrogenase family)